MNIDLPSGNNPPSSDSFFEGRIDLYEAYWLHVDCVRYVGPALEQSEATEEDTDCSPLARHYNHFYTQKQTHTKECDDLPGNLPKYKDHFGEPRGDVRRVSEKNLNNLGIKLNEGDDPIWLPSEYELPDTWDDSLEHLDKQQLQKMVRNLQNDKIKLEKKCNKLAKQLARIEKSITKYTELRDSNNTQHVSNASTNGYMCENCGRKFDSEAAKHGHSPHCDRPDDSSTFPTPPKNTGYSPHCDKPDDSSTFPTPPKNTGHSPHCDKPDGESRSKKSHRTLLDLAEDLPELSESQVHTPHKRGSEEESDNLNHLINGSI